MGLTLAVVMYMSGIDIILNSLKIDPLTLTS